jgi:hypothetical protein
MSFEVKIHFLKELATLFEQDDFSEDDFLLVMQDKQKDVQNKGKLSQKILF